MLGRGAKEKVYNSKYWSLDKLKFKYDACMSINTVNIQVVCACKI